MSSTNNSTTFNNKSSPSTRNRTQSMGSNNSSNSNFDYYLFNGNTKSILKNGNSEGRNGRRFRQYSMEENYNNNLNNNNNSVLGEGRSVVTFFLNSEESPPPPDNTEKRQKHKNRQRASLSSIHPHNLITNSSQPFRRTSLPVQSNRQNLNLSQVHSARGLLMDLLASNNERRDLSPQVTACLRAVTVLLNSDGNTITQQKGGNLIDGNASATALTDLGIPHVADNPYNGETHIGMVG